MFLYNRVLIYQLGVSFASGSYGEPIYGRRGSIDFPILWDDEEARGMVISGRLACKNNLGVSKWNGAFFRSFLAVDSTLTVVGDPFAEAAAAIDRLCISDKEHNEQTGSQLMHSQMGKILVSTDGGETLSVSTDDLRNLRPEWYVVHRPRDHSRTPKYRLETIDAFLGRIANGEVELPLGGFVTREGFSSGDIIV